MKLAFTICTISHLAQAKTMIDSLVKYNSDYQIVIGLFDKINGTDVGFIKNAQLIEINATHIPDFEQLFDRYTVFELSCLAKPYFAHFLFTQNPTLEKLLYFDSDMMIFNKLDSIEATLETSSIVITPHITKPFEQETRPKLRNFLNSGIYNAGFFGLRRDSETLAFLDWWKKRVWHEGYHNFAEGMFVDQLWLNFVPLFFKNVCLTTHLGYNVAYWNLHERQISLQNNQYWVNQEEPLIFYHFSGYKISHPHLISVHQEHYTFESRPDIWPVFKEYHEILIANRHQDYLGLPNAYRHPKRFYEKKKGVRRIIILFARKLLRALNAQ